MPLSCITSHNLLSNRKLYSNNNCSIVSDSNSIRFKENTIGDILLQAPSIANVYLICLPTKSTLVPANLACSTLGGHWDYRLGYYGARVLTVLKKNYVLNVSSSFHDNCMTCHLAT